MKTTKFQRVTALMLALVFLLCGSVISVGASDATGGAQSGGNIISGGRDFNAISYNEYIAQFDNVPVAEDDYVIKATEGYTFVTSAGVVYTPSTDIEKIEEYFGTPLYETVKDYLKI